MIYLNDRFVSSDIIAMVKYACYEPMREAQNARHFRLVTSKKQQKYEPCDESVGEEMELLDIPAENVKLRDLQFVRILFRQNDIMLIRRILS